MQRYNKNLIYTNTIIKKSDEIPVFTILLPSHNVLTILSKKQEIEFKTKKVVFFVYIKNKQYLCSRKGFNKEKQILCCKSIIH